MLPAWLAFPARAMFALPPRAELMLGPPTRAEPTLPRPAELPPRPPPPPPPPLPPPPPPFCAKAASGANSNPAMPRTVVTRKYLVIMVSSYAHDSARSEGWIVIGIVVCLRFGTCKYSFFWPNYSARKLQGVRRATVLVPTLRVGTHCFATLLRRGPGAGDGRCAKSETWDEVPCFG